MESFPPYNRIDHPAITKTRLNSLLLILMATLFASGAALIVLRNIDSYHREQIYSATESTLPAHKVSAAVIEGPKDQCVKLPSELLSKTEYKNWLKKNNISSEFCGETGVSLKFDVEQKLTEEADSTCKESIAEYGDGLFLRNPSQSRSICMGSFGGPDSDMWLNDKTDNLSKRVKFCGTPCRYEAGVWLDNDRFALLETDNISGYSLVHLVEIYDFKNNTKQKWELNISEVARTDLEVVADWKIYRNDEYGFEFEYPSNQYTKSEVSINNESQYIRIQNYSSLDDKMGLEKNEYYLEINLEPRASTDCGGAFADEPNKIKYGNLVGYRGIGNEGGDAGGKRFLLCFDKTDFGSMFFQVTESFSSNTVANKILDSFKFTK